MKNMKWLLVFPLTVAVLALSAGPALADQGEAIIQAIQKNYKGLTSLSAQYTRVTNAPAMEGIFQSTSTHTAAGLLLYKRPAKLVLNQSSPTTEKMVTDGGTVWWYIPDENLVHLYQKVDVYGELKPLLDFFGGIDSLQGQFDVQVTPAGSNDEKNHRLDLTRVQEGSGPSGITVWFSPQDYTLVAFRLEALTGETTDFTLSDVRANPELEDRIFVFTIPKGAQVIEETAN